MVSYLSMATGLGISFVGIHNHGGNSAVHLFREVYYARKSHLNPHCVLCITLTYTSFPSLRHARSFQLIGYIDWLFTTPLLLLSLALLAGLSPSDTVLVILFDVFMIVTGLLGGLVKATSGSGERSRWFFFAISCVGFLGIWWVLITGGAKGDLFCPNPNLTCTDIYA
jgi:bacteriorhodopsin